MVLFRRRQGCDINGQSCDDDTFTVAQGRGLTKQVGGGGKRVDCAQDAVKIYGVLSSVQSTS